jgi:hypothetical protein
MAAKWGQLTLRSILVGLLLGVIVVMVMSFSSSSSPQLVPFLQGQSLGYGWVLDIQGSRGTFYTGKLVWTIEYILRASGINGSTYQLLFLGRRPESFCLLFISANDTGNSFFVDYYNYNENRYRGDRFGGLYDIRGIRAEPTPMPGYLPTAPIPPYAGAPFEISSPYAQITHEGGRIATNELNLQVYPLYQMIVTTTWQEIWALGVDEFTHHSYFLIFYTAGSTAWVIDLWDGQVWSESLGQVRFL